jgi:hypothetical protein
VELPWWGKPCKYTMEGGEDDAKDALIIWKLSSSNGGQVPVLWKLIIGTEILFESGDGEAGVIEVLVWIIEALSADEGDKDGE